MTDPAAVLDTRIGSGRPARREAVTRCECGLRDGQASPTTPQPPVHPDGRRRCRDGYVTAWSCDDPQPNASVLNYWPGAVRANSALLPLSAGGEVCLNSVSYDGTPVSLIADAVGFVPGTVSRPPVPAPPAPHSRHRRRRRRVVLRRCRWVRRCRRVRSVRRGCVRRRRSVRRRTRPTPTGGVAPTPTRVPIGRASIGSMAISPVRPMRSSSGRRASGGSTRTSCARR